MVKELTAKDAKSAKEVHGGVEPQRHNEHDEHDEHDGNTGI
jgi:hypothetical protein